MEEVFRFDNVPVRRGEYLCWDVDSLWGNILSGMRKCFELGIIPISVGIDTWGVDFVLIDGNGERLGEAVCYRDGRTTGMYEAVHSLISEPEIYRRTGIQKQAFNTIYQLMAVKSQTPEQLESAKNLLFIPDYFHYKLCGVMACEETIASTSGLLNAAERNRERDWDFDIIDRCGYPRKIFGAISQPGTVLGGLTEAVKCEVGFDCAVVLPPSHDTASAFFAVKRGWLGKSELASFEENEIILSSGTWSLMGINAAAPILTEAARAAGFTNEVGVGGKIRFLKNIMGLWMLQSVRKELPDKPSFEELMKLAQSSDYDGIVDVNDDAFFAPESMISAVAGKCRESGFAPPQTTGDTVRCVCRSLAREYAKTVRELSDLTGQAFDGITIVGGGNQNTLLNDMTAEMCGIPVHTGPTEGTATGNILCQFKTLLNKINK